MTRILVIDDEVSLLEEIIEILTYEGFEAVGAPNGQKGIEQALKTKPDLILCDVMMPVLDGYGTLLAIRANPSTCNIPFIFLTAKADKSDLRKGMSLGADDYLTKPFTISEILNAIQTRLNKKAALEQEVETKIERLNTDLARERERLIMKSRFVSMVTHEFRNPLTALLSSIELLRYYSSSLSDKDKSNYLDGMEQTVNILTQLLEDLLLVGELETGSVDVKWEEINLDEYLAYLLKEVRLLAGPAHNIVAKNNLDSQIISDRKLLRQIFINLLSNAIKYSPNGGQILLEINSQDKMLVIRVSDEGIGIPDKDKDNLFKAFKRASNTGKIKGTGLGLVIVKQAVDMLKGDIRVESELGKGTTIIVTLPEEG